MTELEGQNNQGQVLRVRPDVSSNPGSCIYVCARQKVQMTCITPFEGLS